MILTIKIELMEDLQARVPIHRERKAPEGNWQGENDVGGG